MLPLSKPFVRLQPSGWLAEFRTGVRAQPWLADHGFHDMTVLPGAWHIAIARQLHRELFQTEALSLRDIVFENPVILAEDEVTLTVRTEEQAEGGASYEIFEASADEVLRSRELRPCAQLRINSGTAFQAVGPVGILSAAGTCLSRREFYERLRANGNQYGPLFQTLSEVRAAGAEMIGRLAPGDTFSPMMLDAAAQLLAAFTLGEGRTFVLKSIAQLNFSPRGDAVPAWLRASQASDGATGCVDFFDADGAPLARLSGMSSAFLDRPAASNELRLGIVANFTAEPLEDALRFWGRHFGREVRVEFAPYNQVFQQLLDPAGAFRRQRDGLQAIVLSLEEWQREQWPALRVLDPSSLDGQSLHSLPNGVEIAHLNRYETEYVYREIFEDESYLRHGIALADGATVIDIGANIGLFTLFVLSRCRPAAIFAFEPSPRTFEALQANCAAFGEPGVVRAFRCGVAEHRGEANFTFYEHSSVFSSFHPDASVDGAAVEAVVRNVLAQELDAAADDADVATLTSRRLEAQTLACSLTSVSDIIRENGLGRIDLLKIDAEKSELGILRGIAEEHWPLINQIVMEVHDRSGAAVREIEEMLAQHGFHSAVVEEKLLERSGLFNIYATRGAAAPRPDERNELARRACEFCAAFDAFAAASSAPLILAIAPPTHPSLALDAAEERLRGGAARHAHVRFLGSREIAARHPVPAWHDAHSRQLGHMPFTTEGYAALATALFRAVAGIGAPPLKVIALDADNTLWQGTCGEDGALGVRITAPFRRLQEFLLAQREAGVLLALCSKNREADALAVLDQHPDMLLRREHFAAWQINWDPKPQSLRALAAQLSLGLESFVFLDDNPVECAAVRAACPEVVALRLPADPEHIPAFLENVWRFDRAPAATSEDRARGEWYRANVEREESRAAAPTLRAFLDGLQLRLEVTDPGDDQLVRVAQLTQRTNQFNFTTRRRSEAELHELLRSGVRCFVVSVSDRFGEYGLVGAALYFFEADRCVVDTLLLSCRALGKGVEHRMVAELAARALRAGKALVEFSWRRTERNEPARAFLERLAGAAIDADVTLALPAAALVNLRYELDEAPTPALAPLANSSPRGAFARGLSAAWQAAAEELASIEGLVAAMHEARMTGEPAAAELTPIFGASPLEQTIAEIWKKALGRAQLGLDENFFDAGGTSLKAVVVVAMIRKELHKNLPLVALFESPTVRLLAARLDDAAESAAGAAAAESAGSRGRERRQRLMKRRSA